MGMMDLTLCIKERFQEVFVQKIKQLGMKPEAPQGKMSSSKLDELILCISFIESKETKKKKIITSYFFRHVLAILASKISLSSSKHIFILQ